MENYIEAFVRLVNDNAKKGMVVAEVGVFNGDTSVRYLPTIRENGGTCFLVDWFKGSTGAEVGLHRFNPDGANGLQLELEERVANIGCAHVVTIFAGDSIEMADKIEDGSLDICFIDADHRYEFVKKDILTYLPKVKKGGILCGHDAENNHLMDTLTEEERHIDYVGGKHCHPGVLFALKEIFVSQNKPLEYYEDYGMHRIPIGIYRV
jgi:hypothetical protein